MNKIIILIITVFIWSCSDFKYKKHLVNNFYIVDHESAKGKSLIRFYDKNNGDFGRLVGGYVQSVGVTLDTIIVFETRNNKYYLLDTKIAKYREDMKEISRTEFRSLMSRCTLNYEYNTKGF